MKHLTIASDIIGAHTMRELSDLWRQSTNARINLSDDERILLLNLVVGRMLGIAAAREEEPK